MIDTNVKRLRLPIIFFSPKKKSILSCIFFAFHFLYFLTHRSNREKKMN